MGFWSGYWSSMKSLDVEEPIDAYVHRPVGYIIAKLCYATRISPDQLTMGSIVLGVASGVLFAVRFPYHLPIGSLALFLSAAVDCSDGMLARMRGTSSAFGRMLDGLADLFTVTAAVLGSFIFLLSSYWTPWWHAALAGALAAVTIFTSSFHTTGYDHYKNVYLRVTCPGSREGEDLEAAIARYEASRHQPTRPLARLGFPIYLFYLKAQRDWILGFDPHTKVRLDALPPYDAERAAIYRRHAGPAMRVWKGFFGTGSLIFGLALFNAFGRPELFLLWRLLVLNGIFHLYLKPLQRRASQQAFAEMGLPLGALA